MPGVNIIPGGTSSPRSVLKILITEELIIGQIAESTNHFAERMISTQ